MLIRVGYDIECEQACDSAVVAALFVHPSRSQDLETPDKLVVTPAVPVEEFIDPFGNRCARLTVPAGSLQLTGSAVVRDSGLPDPVDWQAPALPVERLPVDTLQFLLPSRYCEVDSLSTLAWSLFSNTAPGWQRVQAICDWVHQNMQFGYHFARATRTAAEASQERCGVCRDFQHLAVTLCRAMHIPARYATGYLGDIGVPAAPDPMDFSAWFEVWLGDRWWTFDARHNERRIGRVLVATGRDPADVAITTSFGASILRRFSVVIEEVTELMPAGMAR